MLRVDRNQIQIAGQDVPIPERSRVVYRIVKRVFDFLFSLILGILLLIPMGILAAVIAIKDGGNPIYKQKRVGKDGKPLYIYKFRSMQKGADDLVNTLTPEQQQIYLEEYKLENDPRLIGYRKDGKKCFGAKIRSMSIDEIPQILLNICIFGNMSMVGPRPILQSELERNYTQEERKLLLSVKPGLTGYWQAYARNAVGYIDHARQDMELFYIRNRSLWLDIKILCKTVKAVIEKKGV